MFPNNYRYTLFLIYTNKLCKNPTILTIFPIKRSCEFIDTIILYHLESDHLKLSNSLTS